MDKVRGPLDVSQAKLGSQIVEIGMPTIVSVCAHGGEGRGPLLAQSVVSQAFKGPAALEIRPGFLHRLMVQEGLHDGVDPVLHRSFPLL
jgi:hypothetical protein